MIDKIFNGRELVPAIVQDSDTNEVLMLAYMNRDSYSLTLKTGTAWFFSRSRQKLWNKGETSGNFLYINDIATDCDYDTILLRVTPKGPACHTGSRSCFFNKITKA